MTERIAAFILLSIVWTQAAAVWTLTRVSAFEYDPNTGLLIREAIEPDNSNLCLVKTHVRDVFGNITGTTARNCNGTSSGGLTEALAPTGNAVFVARTVTTQYQAGSVTIGGVVYSYPAGQFPTITTNPLNQSETRTFDPRFAGKLSLTDPNSLSTTWTFDKFGAKTNEARPDGTSTAWSYSLCGTPPNYCGHSVTATTTGAPTSTSYFDSLNRTYRTEAQGFDGTLVRKDTQYDSLSRVTASSDPYFSTGTPGWTTFVYDIVGRVTQQTEPNGALTKKNYFGLNTSTVYPTGQVEWRYLNSQGQLKRVVRE